MREDEQATVRILTTYRTVLTNLVEKYRGRVVDSPGDNVLAEFGSVVDAVNCGVEIQRELAERNAEVLENRRMRFRIGINMGDVLEEGTRIYGDGVNIAARMEGLANAGQICISGTVYDAIENKIGLEYESLGEHQVKNIDKPVRAYRVLSYPGAAAHRVVRANLKKMAYPLPDKPSIAVLPFVNMSDDLKQEYFSDGMTEDLITDLSKISGLFVIARNSTFVYKGKSVKIAHVAEELGVRYVLEGSVRKAGEKLRINAQLIDATTGGHLWSERYDGATDDIFALQDKINQKIVAALAVKLTEGEKALVAQKGTKNLKAHDECVKGWEHYKRYTSEEWAKADACFKKALELDPKYARARAALAQLYWDRTNWGLGIDSRIARIEARLLARHHLRETMKEPTSIAYRLAGHMDVFMRKHDAAISHLEKALSLDPNDPFILASLSYALSMAGRPIEAIEASKKAMRLDPLNPAGHFWIGLAHFCMGEWEEAAAVLEKGLKVNPEVASSASTLAAAYAHLGRIEDARAAYETYRKNWGDFPIPLASLMYFWPFKDRRVADSFAEGLIKAGLPAQMSDYIHVSNEDQLTKRDLRAFCGSTVAGLNRDGSQWSFQIDKDGNKGIYRGPPGPLAEGTPWSGEDTARRWLEGDSLCSQYEKRFGGMEIREVVYKNPRGTPERKDEYVSIGDLGMSTWSPVR
jgi:TolB-like protein